MATIFEVLQNAKLSLAVHRHEFGERIGRQQLINAVTLLEKGYELDDDADVLFDEYGMLECIPCKDPNQDVRVNISEN